MRLVLLLSGIILSIPPPDGIRVVRLDGEEVTPASLEIDPSGKVTFKGEGGQAELPLQDLRSIAFARLEPGPILGPTLFLAEGGVIRGEVLKADGELLRFRSAMIREAEIPLSVVRAFRLPGATMEDSAFRNRLEVEKGGDSIFLLQEGKLIRVPGAFRSLDEESVSLVWEGEEKVIPRQKVYGVVLSGASPPRGRPTARVALSDGSRFGGEIQGMDAADLQIAISPEATLTCQRAGVARIDIISNRLAFLSDLEPEKVEEVPYFNTVWPYRKDRSLDGNAIRLGGKTYAKGLSVHSRCTLTYKLAGQFESFSAVIGIDDETKHLGHVIFRVRADGETLLDSGGVGGDDEPRRIRIDVGGRETLVLEVDFGEDLDIGDHADWADAHLVRKS